MSRKLLHILIIFLLVLSCLNGCSENETTDTFSMLPQLVLEKEILRDGTILRPVRLQLLDDTLYISYDNLARIDKYTTDLLLVDSILLDDPEKINPTAFKIIDSLLVVINHAKHLVIIYDREGNFKQSFGTTPLGEPLYPFSLDAYGGVAYIGDLGLRKILAISLVDASNLTELGELILTIPSDTESVVPIPSSVRVTYDGRLLVGEALSGILKVYTCDGRFIYDFDSIPDAGKMITQGIDRDNVIDPSMQDSSSFDPSGIRNMGRYHVVDANNKSIHMFNPVGDYIGSYSGDSTLVKPSGLAIDRKNQKIFVADPGLGKLLVFQYER